MAQHSGPGEARRPRARRRRAGAGNKRTATAAGAGTGTGMAGGSVLGQLYWADSDSIWAANMDGTNIQNLLPAYEATMGVAVDSSHVYWINRNTGAVRRANPDGGNPRSSSAARTTRSEWRSTPSERRWRRHEDQGPAAGRYWIQSGNGWRRLRAGRGSGRNLRPSQHPALVDGILHQGQQAGLGGRIHPGRDPATQPQRPFPSTSSS